MSNYIKIECICKEKREVIVSYSKGFGRCSCGILWRITSWVELGRFPI